MFQLSSSDEDWHPVAVVSDIPRGEMIGVKIGNRQVAIYNVGGTFYATDNVCTHAFALLTEGWLEDNIVECPLHAGCFDVCTGKALGDPVDEDLRTYAVRVWKDRVEVLVSLAG